MRVTGWLRIRPSLFHGDEGRRVGICHTVSTPNLVVITEAVVARVVEKDQPSFIGSSLTPRRTW
jgi:hypothetical protein